MKIVNWCIKQLGGYTAQESYELVIEIRSKSNRPIMPPMGGSVTKAMIARAVDDEIRASQPIKFRRAPWPRMKKYMEEVDIRNIVKDRQGKIKTEHGEINVNDLYKETPSAS